METVQARLNCFDKSEGGSAMGIMAVSYTHLREAYAEFKNALE